MIRKEHITQYISYLYQLRKGEAVPDNVLKSWQDLSESEIQIHLKQMYAQWQLNEHEIKNYEYAFLQKLKVEPIVEIKSKPIAIEKKSSNTKNIISFIIGAAILGAGGYYYLETNKKNPPIAQSNTGNAMEIKEVSSTSNTIKAIDPEDKENAKYIAQWISLENNKAVPEIFNLLAPNVVIYKKIDYPTEEEIFEYYYDLYNNHPNYSGKVMDIKNKGKRKYMVKVQQSLSKGVKNVTYTIEFDEQHKIIRIKE